MDDHRAATTAGPRGRTDESSGASRSQGRAIDEPPGEDGKRDRRQTSPAPRWYVVCDEDGDIAYAGTREDMEAVCRDANEELRAEGQADGPYTLHAVLLGKGEAVGWPEEDR